MAAEEQVYPLNKALREYFESRDYRDRVKAAQKGLEFIVDRECFPEEGRRGSRRFAVRAEICYNARFDEEMNP